MERVELTNGFTVIAVIPEDVEFYSERGFTPVNKKSQRATKPKEGE